MNASSTNAIPTTVIIDPELSFERLKTILFGEHWRQVDVSASPLLPGEPEHATFERNAGERLHYTFNPVCALRVIELHNTGALPLLTANVELVGVWLASSDIRVQLRGVLAARILGATGLIDSVQALSQHPQAAIAQAAVQTAKELRALDEARRKQLVGQLASVSTALLEEQLRPLLVALAKDSDGSVTATLQPRDEDYARAFTADVVEHAREQFQALWADAPRVARAAPDCQLVMHIAPAGMLAEDNALSWQFPGGYRSIAPKLNPHRTWVAWKYIARGQTAGMSYDGLVWLDDHWVWFPKPYRVLAKSTKT